MGAFQTASLCCLDNLRAYAWEQSREAWVGQRKKGRLTRNPQGVEWEEREEMVTPWDFGLQCHI